MVRTGTGSLEPHWTLRDWIAAAGIFLATGGVILWQNAHVAVLFDLSYILNTAQRIALGQMPYRDFPLAHPPLTFLIQAAVIRLTGRVIFHHVLYAALIGGLGSVLAWRIVLGSLRGRVAEAWPIALLVAAPLCVLGIYCIVPNPEYDCDCGFWILVAVWMLMRVDGKTGAAFGFAAGVALCVPVFFKQNMGLPLLLVGIGAVLLLLVADLIRRGKPQSEGAEEASFDAAKEAAKKGLNLEEEPERPTSGAKAQADFAGFVARLKSCPDTHSGSDGVFARRVKPISSISAPRPFKARDSHAEAWSAANSSGPKVSVLLAVLVGVCVTLAAAALALHWTAGIGNYLHWTIEYAGKRRLPGFGLMLEPYRDPSLLWTLPCVVIALILLRSPLAKVRWARIAAFALMAAPFLFTIASLFLYEDADERGDALLALWPLLLVLGAALTIVSLFRLRRGPSLRGFLPLLLLAAIHGTFMSQQLWGSTYGIWPLLIILIAELIAFLAGWTVFGDAFSETVPRVAKGGADSVSESPEFSFGSKQTAEEEWSLKAELEMHTSGAEARVDFDGSTPGINPRPTARASFSAACKTQSTFLSPMRGLRPPPPSESSRSASNLAATGSGMALVMAAVISVTLLVCGGFYMASEERLSYAYIPDGPTAHSAFPQLAGLATPGPYLPEIDELLRYAQANIPLDDGIVLLPGEEPFYFSTGRVPRFPVPFFDPTIDPYSPAEIVSLVQSHNIRWLIAKRNVQTKEDPTPDREALMKALTREFTVTAQLHGYDVYRRKRE